MVTSLQQEYNDKGYVIVRNAIDVNLARETAEHVHWLRNKYPDIRPEQIHHKMLIDDPFMHRLAGDDRLLNIVEQFIGPNIALFAAHYIAKPPKLGQEVLWHQDGTYWPLEPMEVITLWLAATESTRENGCLRVLPGTQNSRLMSRDELMEKNDGTNVLASGIHPSEIDDSNAVDLELDPGDVSIHNPTIIHGSQPNSSDKWRIGLTLRYIPTTTWVKSETHTIMHLRGERDATVPNMYASRPVFDSDKHMTFVGHEGWQ